MDEAGNTNEVVPMTPDRPTGLDGTMGEVTVGADDKVVADKTESIEPTTVPPDETGTPEPVSEAAPRAPEGDGVVVTLRGPAGESNVRITRGYVIDSNGVVLTEKEVAERNRTM